MGTETPPPGDEQSPRERLRVALAPRAGARQLLIGVLFVALGFGAVAATRSTADTGLLATARPDEVVRVLDDLTERQARLQAEQRSLEVARDQLLSGDEQQQLQASRERADALAILAGTVRATGPGIVVTITDATGAMTPALLLNAVEELRDAGAEAIQVGGVRVVASTWFEVPADGPGVSVSGTVVASPYRLLVIGDPPTLATALEIPGGVADAVRTAAGRIDVAQRPAVVVSALQPVTTPHYARPAPSPSGS